MQREVLWASKRWVGLEVAAIADGDMTPWSVESSAVHLLTGRGMPIAYRLSCDADWRTTAVRISVGLVGGVELQLRADGHGHWWDSDERPLRSLDGCLDVDISVTPLTNTLPIRRLNLAPAESQDIAVAYVEVPQLSVRRSMQRYTCLSRSGRDAKYRYESGAFGVDLTVDQDGLVVDYPGIWRRVIRNPRVR